MTANNLDSKVVSDQKVGDRRTHPSTTASTPRMRRESLVEISIVAAVLLACGAASLRAGQDSTWDLYNYHFYIGYSLLHGRLDVDIAPVGLRSYLNPVLDAFHYLALTQLSPHRFGFLMGMLQGLNPALVFLLARRLFDRGRSSLLLASLAALLAATGPNARSLLGTTTGDTTVSIPALLALLLLLSSRDGVRPARMLAVGILGGVAVGLKLTMGPFLVAFAVVALVMLAGRRSSGLGFLAFSLGTGLGFLAIGGYWAFQMWHRFGNPLFPFLNDVFHSPYAPALPLRDLRWAARGVLDYVNPPFYMALGFTGRLQEVSFRDARLLLVLLAAALWIALRLMRRRGPLRPCQRDLLVFFVVGYVVWSIAFYYYRYAVTLEFLAPVVLFVLVGASLRRFAPAVLLAASVLVVATSTVGSWGRLPWRDEWFRVRLPPQAYEPNAFVLVHGQITSFALAFFPPQTRFLGLSDSTERFDQLVAANLAVHRGPVLLLSWPGYARQPGLERFGLTLTGECRRVRTAQHDLRLCRIARLAQGSSRPSSN